MQDKQYNVKIYTLAGVFVRVLPAIKQMGSLTFSESLNAGQGEMRMRLKYDFSATDIQYNQIIKVYESDTTHTARCIYSGIIGSLRRISENGSDYLEVRAVGLASILSWFYYHDGSGFAFTKSDTPEAIMQDIINYANTKYPGLITYTPTSMEVAGTTSNISFDYTKCLESLQKVATTAPNFWWVIDQDGILQFRPTVGSSYAVLHKITMGVAVDKVIVEENTEKLVNRYFMSYNGGNASGSDATSIANNGLRELKELRTDINNSATANTAVAAFLAQNKDFKRRIQITINEKYDIESIHAGHFITISNFEYPITALQVQKIQYNIDSVELELEDVTSFAKEVFN